MVKGKRRGRERERDLNWLNGRRSSLSFSLSLKNRCEGFEIRYLLRGGERISNKWKRFGGESGLENLISRLDGQGEGNNRRWLSVIS